MINKAIVMLIVPAVDTHRREKEREKKWLTIGVEVKSVLSPIVSYPLSVSIISFFPLTPICTGPWHMGIWTN